MGNIMRKGIYHYGSLFAVASPSMSSWSGKFAQNVLHDAALATLARLQTRRQNWRSYDISWLGLFGWRVFASECVFFLWSCVFMSVTRYCVCILHLHLSATTSLLLNLPYFAECVQSRWKSSSSSHDTLQFKFINKCL